MPVTYMTVVKPSGDIDHVDILSFEEPEDYLPPARWLALYKNRALGNDLAVGRAIPHITGASLSSQAINDGIRLMLAIYQVGVKGTL
jgi:electron transport complex protein RnfG